MVDLTPSLLSEAATKIETEAEEAAAAGGGSVRTHQGTGRPRAEQDRMTRTDDATAGASCHAIHEI